MTDDVISPPLAKLAAALAKVQAELPTLERDRTVEVTQKNGEKYSYSYVTLATLTEKVLPILSAHGLAFSALPGTGSDGKMCVRYMLIHDSGESLSGEFPISGEGGIQMIGGRITYVRRYCLSAVVGIAADEDDEARLAAETGPKTAQRAATPRSPRAATERAGPGPNVAQRAPGRAGPPLPDETTPLLPGQRGKIVASFDAMGIDNRTERLTITAGIIGRDLGSVNDLTKREASNVLDVLAAAAADSDPAAYLRNFLPDDTQR